jgi:predicted Zn-dependent peptidase
VENAKRACKLDRGNDFISTLAKAYAENGEFEKARAAATEGMEMAHDEADKQACRKLLETIAKGKPYHEPPHPR